MKQTLESIHRRINDSTANRSAELVTEVNACISAMKVCVGVMTDNVDVYYRGMFETIFWRRLPPGGLAYSPDDIDKIEQATTKCINVVDEHNKHK